jgi:hypothetical protein
VVPWSHGGTTALDNLCSLWRRHHAYVHELGFRMARDDAGDWQFFTRDGRVVPPTGDLPHFLDYDPLAALRARAHDDGVVVDSATSLPDWDGRPADYGVIVWSLLQSTPAP